MSGAGTTRFRRGTAAIALAFSQALLPDGDRFAAADEETVRRLEEILSGYGPVVFKGYGLLLTVLDAVTRFGHAGRRFRRLPRETATRVLVDWSGTGGLKSALIAALAAPAKVAFFDDPKIYATLGGVWRPTEPAVDHGFGNDNADLVSHSQRWESQIIESSDFDFDEIECDVVVVGTGAGGAVMAKELSDHGLAVLMVEAGPYLKRQDFSGATVPNIQRMYVGKGMTGAIGNAAIPIPLGQLVGGTTAINCGTCFRTPSSLLVRWADELGSADLMPERMEQYFERVESVLQVADADPKYVGAVGEIIGRGCDKLGYAHRPLRRNAPDCDGAGVCTSGCPTGAKRSTDVSYVPLALANGAQLVTNMRADAVLLENGVAVGLTATARDTGRRVRIRARATVLSCGTLTTPTLLQRQGFDASLKHIGRHLSIHPAVGVSALFDEEVKAYNAIPQGYLVDEFHRDGFMLEGCTVPIDVGSAQFGAVGDDLIEVMESYDRIASFGVMVADRSRGRVRPGKNGRPRITYWLGRQERQRLRRGVTTLARIFLAAGAVEVYPGLRGMPRLHDASELERLAESRNPSRDWLLSAHHPIGTCRMARSPSTGVVSADHEVFGTPGLYIADGSVLPSSPTVNPQVTIMALATRAADRLANRLNSS